MTKVPHFDEWQLTDYANPNPPPAIGQPKSVNVFNDFLHDAGSACFDMSENWRQIVADGMLLMKLSDKLGVRHLGRMSI